MLILLSLLFGVMLALTLFVPVVGIPLLVISVALYGFGKGFFGYLIKHISKKNHKYI